MLRDLLTSFKRRPCSVCRGTGKGIGDFGQKINCCVCGGSGRV